MESFAIYGLYDEAEPLAIRYIGQTIERRYKARLREHVTDCLRDATRSACWIRSVIRRGGVIGSSVLDVASSKEQANDLERYYIARARSMGIKLTNLTEGGDGTLGWIPSDKRRSEMAIHAAVVWTGRKHTEATKLKMSEAHKGAVVSSEARSKISRAFSGRKLSAEHIQKVSEALRGKSKSRAHRARLSKANKVSLRAIASSMANLKKAQEVTAQYAGKRAAALRTPEARARMSAALRRFFLSDAGQIARRRLSEARSVEK